MIRKVTFGLTCVFLLAGAIAFYLYRSAQTGPEFYQKALAIQGEKAHQLGDELENLVLTTHNQIVRDAQWSLTIHQDQLNGWFDSQLSRKYPRLNPKQIKQPRVNFRENEIRVGMKVQSRWLSGIACFHVEPFITSDQRNLGLRIRKAYVGSLPISRKKIVDQLTQTATDLDFAIAWTEVGGDPVALLSPGFQLAKNTKRKFVISAIQVTRDEIRVSGSASDIGSPSSRPSPDQRTTDSSPSLSR